MSAQQLPIVLLVEDNPAEQNLARRALDISQVPCELHLLSNGEEALDYLYKRGPHASARHPALLLLDLNMPRIDGRTVLEKVKSDAQLRHIPVIVFTTSNQQQDIQHCYELGCNSYIIKPLEIKKFIHILAELSDYWLNLVELPKS